ncbi:MAG: efflux RND transporter periplasmic adaptor subunit [Candidatus Zixiibacteriota bacterium]
MNRNKKIMIIVGVGILAIFVFVLLFFGRAKETQAKYTTAKIERGDISVVVTATGTLNALTTVQVGSQVSGTISQLYADFNSTVKKGQLIAQLDPTFLKEQVAQSEADLEKANAQANQAKRDLDRAKGLSEKNLISQSDLDVAQTNYELALAGQKSSKATVERSITNLAYATITSPIDGVVISRNVDVGQTVAASLSAPTLFTIANDLTKMQVETSIDEADIGKIQVGQKVDFTVDAYPDKHFAGSVSQIRLNPSVVQNVVTYTVIIDVDNPELLLKPGMTANVMILIDQREDVLKVRSAALKFTPSMQRKAKTPTQTTGNSYSANASPNRNPGRDFKKWASSPKVWILAKDGRPKPVLVQAGLSDGSVTEVISDSLKEGEEVIISQVNGSSNNTTSQDVNPFSFRPPGAAAGRR